jgi:hypothetical protein
MSLCEYVTFVICIMFYTYLLKAMHEFRGQTCEQVLDRGQTCEQVLDVENERNAWISSKNSGLEPSNQLA